MSTPRTPFYSFASGVGSSDESMSAHGIGSSAFHPRTSSRPGLAGDMELGVGTSDASPGVGSSDTSPGAGSPNEPLRAGACNAPLRAGPGNTNTSTTRADPSDNARPVTVQETVLGVGASDNTAPHTNTDNDVDFWDDVNVHRQRNKRFVFRHIARETGASSDDDSRSQASSAPAGHDNTPEAPQGAPPALRGNDANDNEPSPDQQPQRWGEALTIWFPLPRH
ncbi:uncharacterized protein [Procambarus clarkii]|uniref:uncharacterized protein n=1 Tax=Procambarus clarkii TaxID=6728 RepID=UPI0037432B67